MVPISQTASFGLVMPGEAMWVPFQAGFAVELGLRLQQHGYGEQPFDVAVGSSSGSLVAALAAAGSFDHGRIQEALVAFADETRIRLGLRRPINPYPQALKNVFDRGLVDTVKASASRTHLVVTASHYENTALWDAGSAGASALVSGVERFLKAKKQGSCDFLQGVERFLEAGARLVAPRYFSNKPMFLPEKTVGEQSCRLASTPESLRFAVEASARIPGLYGRPIKDGADLLIDGAFSDNAPVKLALELGARYVFVVTSSRSGNVFDRPFQNIARSGARSALQRSSKALRDRLPILKQLRDRIPEPESVNLKTLRAQYPHQRVFVVHPSKKIKVNRFLETNPAILRELYDMGRHEARHALIPVAREALQPDTAA